MKRAVLTLVACGLLSVFSFARETHSAELQGATLRMDWLPISYHAPFYLAKEKGYYSAAGIDLGIEDGKGSGATIQLVATDKDTFGLADASIVAKSIAQGVPVKLVMGIFRRSAVAIVFPGQNPIHKPADLKGKKLATCPGDAPAILLPAYLRAVNLSPTDVEIVNVDCGSKYTVVARGLADATLGFGPYGPTMFGAAGIKNVRELDYADAGLNVPSHGLIASLNLISSNPDLIRKFVAATSKGWQEARQNPDAAITAMVKAVPLMKGKEEVLKTEFKGYLNYLDTPATEGKPFGWQSEDDWKKAEGILVQYMSIPAQPSVGSYYTNDFIPR
jgi:NitT/TauT family transport system substrate-binding protein